MHTNLNTQDNISRQFENSFKEMHTYCPKSKTGMHKWQAHPAINKATQCRHCEKTLNSQASA